jgi:DNA repair protein RadA/Sms
LTRIIVPQMKGIEGLKTNIKLFQVKKVEEAFRILFG